MTQIILSEIPTISGNNSEHDRWHWQVSSRKVSRQFAADVQHMAEILAEANRILKSACVESDAVTKKAFEQGMQLAEEAIAMAIAESLVNTQQEAKAYLDAAEPRIVQLVFAVIRRILPQLSADAVLDSLVDEALRAIQDRHYVRVCVSPGMEKGAQTLAGQWRQRLPEIGRLEVATDEQLAPTECRVESPHGHVSVNMQDRFEKIVRAYEQLLQQKKTPSHHE